jgi:hypothetical protein
MGGGRRSMKMPSREAGTRSPESYAYHTAAA